MSNVNKTKEEIDAQVAAAKAAADETERQYEEGVLDPTGSAAHSAELCLQAVEDCNTVVAAEVELLNENGRKLRSILDRYRPIQPDIPNLPDTAIPNEWFAAYFAASCTPATPFPFGKVYLSRVPWARSTDAGVVNTDSAVNTEQTGVQRKLMDNWDSVNNRPLRHKCYTDTAAGEDDYYGKEWAFFHNRCNYIIDDYGVKHITAVEGQAYQGVTFDENKPTGVFGPAFWAVCELEHYQDPVTGVWHTSDGTENGVPLYQLWGISDSPWESLDQGRRDELTAHGITQDKLRLWSECKVWNNETQQWVERPYWVHSAYMGGYEYDAVTGVSRLVSKVNTPMYNNVSYGTIYTKNQKAEGGRINGFGVLFDIVKNATKNSQSIHYGNINNTPGAVIATASTRDAGYIYPVASVGSFKVGCTVRLWQTNTGSSYNVGAKSASNQYGRIVAIESRTFTDADGAEQTKTCLVMDRNSCVPFYVRTSIDAAKALSDEGLQACCYASQGPAMAGETYVGGKFMSGVMGRHDGSVTSNTDGYHPYRVQGTEYACGYYMCCSDMVAINGTGTQITMADGTVETPTSTNYVHLYCPPNINRYNESGASLANYILRGYVPVGITPSVTSNQWCTNAVLDTVWGCVYPVLFGGSSASGHADYCYTGASPAEWLVGGYLSHGANAGSLCVSLYNGLSTAGWNFGARD